MEKFTHVETVFPADLFCGKTEHNLHDSQAKPESNFECDIYPETFDIPDTLLIEEEDTQVYSGSCKYNLSQANDQHFCLPSDGVEVHQIQASKIKQGRREGFGESTIRVYQCEECDASFKRKALLVNHRKKHSSGPPYPCDTCTTTYENEDDWFDHRETGCLGSETIMPQKTRYFNKKQTKGRKGFVGKTLACRHCSQTFKSVCSRNNHEHNIHKRLRPYSCDECGKTFYRKFNLGVHKQKHSSERPHECHICNKRFKSTVSLKMHAKLHTDKRPFMCHICGKVFKTLSVLESHHSVHTQETKFTCSICGRGYRYRASLFLHMRKHTGHRPYKCSECGFSFMVKSHLTDHFKIHSGYCPFQCEFCSASFPRPLGLKKHLMSHLRAGLELNLDVVLYRAKVKANMKPRTPILNIQQHTVNDVSKDSFGDNEAPLFNSPESDDTLVVVTITSTGDGSTCCYNIKKVFPTNDVSQESNCISKVFLYNKFGVQDEEQFIYGNSFICNDELVENMPLILSVNESADEMQVASGELPHIINEEQVSLMSLTTVEGLAADDKGYCDNIVSTTIEPISVGCDEAAFLEDSLNKLLLNHQDISIVGQINTSNGDPQPNTRIQSQEHQLSQTGANSAAPGEGKSSRKPLKKCRYCNTSYRYLALLEAHEANHSLKERSRSVRTTVPEEKCLQLFNDQNPDNCAENNLPFKCDKCNSSFSFRSELRKHVKLHSLRYHYTCKKCNQAFQQEAFLARHQCGQFSSTSLQNNQTLKPLEKTNDSEQRLKFKCNRCGQVFEKKFILKVHRRKHTGERPFACQTCNGTFISATHRRVHRGIHTGERPFSCTACGKSYMRKCSLQHHKRNCRVLPIKESASEYTSDSIKTVDEDAKSVNDRGITNLTREFNASGIYLVTSLPEDHATHTNITISPHGIEDISTISLEDKMNSEEIKIFEVNMTMNDEKENLINSCLINKLSNSVKAGEERDNHQYYLKATKPQYNLRYTTLSHSSKQKKNSQGLFQCSVCEKSFKFHSLLLNHGRTHTGEKPFQCHICSKAFSKKSNMVIHMRIHTPDRPYLCDHCGKGFKYKSSLDTHERLHTKETPFPCRLCGKRFRHEASRYVHMKRHAVEKAFKCGVCIKAFVTKIDFQNHMRTHTGEKPFQCNICQRRFSAHQNLTKHWKCHTGENQFKCQCCNLASARAGTCKRHMEKHLKSFDQLA